MTLLPSYWTNCFSVKVDFNNFWLHRQRTLFPRIVDPFTHKPLESEWLALSSIFLSIEANLIVFATSAANNNISSIFRATLKSIRTMAFCYYLPMYYIKMFFFKWAIPGLFSLFSSFQYTVDGKQMFNINIIFYRWLVSNRGPWVLEATALTTEPQPLPKMLDLQHLK